MAISGDDDRIPIEYRMRARREHNEHMRALAAASREEARRLQDLDDFEKAEGALRDAEEFEAQIVSEEVEE